MTTKDYFEEGDKCPNHNCDGHMVLPPVEGCTCHCGHPPCSACVNNTVICNQCSWSEGDPIYTATVEPEKPKEDDRHKPKIDHSFWRW